MVSIEESRKALGASGNKLSDKEVEMLNERMSKLAGVLFDMWNKDMREPAGIEQASLSPSTI